MMLCAGSTCLALFPNDEQTVKHEKVNTVGMRHIAFRVDKFNFNKAQIDLTNLGKSFRVLEHENCNSIYFDDPSDHTIELTTYDLIRER